MDRKAVWLLNFDAEEELSRPTGYTLSPTLQKRSNALREQLVGLVGPSDIVLTEGKEAQWNSNADSKPLTNPLSADSHAAKNCIGRAWCPTPRAQKTFARLGISMPAAPSLDVLRRVNHRFFCADLGQTLPGAHYVATCADDLFSIVSRPSITGPWLMKRPFGFAGRGRLKVDPSREADLRHSEGWVRASFRLWGGLQLEPQVTVLSDFALHGHLGREGQVVIGRPTKQVCDEHGAWLSTHLAEPGDLSSKEEGALVGETERAATALRQAGYWGPFGVDGYRYKTPSGEVFFNGRGEINARYSMGWAIGMGDRRPDLVKIG